MSISFVTNGDGVNYAGGSGITASAGPFNQTGGHLIVVYVRSDNSNAGCTITDTAGNTYINAGNIALGTVYAFYVLSCIGNSSNTIVAHPSGSMSALEIMVREFSTTASGFVFLGQAAANGVGSLADAGSISYLPRTSVITSGEQAGNPGWTAGSGFTLTNTSDGFGGYTSYQHKLVSSTINATAVPAGSPSWVINSMAFGEVVATTPPFNKGFVNGHPKTNRKTESSLRSNGKQSVTMRANLPPAGGGGGGSSTTDDFWYYRNRRRYR